MAEDPFVVRLVPERTTVMVGEPVALGFVVENHSQTHLFVWDGGDYRNRFGRPDSFNVTVIDAAGDALPPLDAGEPRGGHLVRKEVPVGGRYSYRLFLPHWATITQPGTYRVVAARTLDFTTTSFTRILDEVPSVLVAASAAATITVVPADREKFGTLIEQLAALTRQKNTDQADQAVVSLAAIHDERTVPHFAALLKTEPGQPLDYRTAFTAIKALSKYDSDAALAALKGAMDISGDDLAGMDVSNQDWDIVAGFITKQTLSAPRRDWEALFATGLRCAAAGALAHSPHPEAKAFLLTRLHDEPSRVRLFIVHLLGHMDPQQAAPLLREMTTDEDKDVRDEAERLLREAAENQTAAPPAGAAGR